MGSLYSWHYGIRRESLIGAVLLGAADADAMAEDKKNTSDYDPYHTPKPMSSSSHSPSTPRTL
jgi:hypothetical protein